MTEKMSNFINLSVGPLHNTLEELYDIYDDLIRDGSKRGQKKQDTNLFAQYERQLLELSQHPSTHSLKSLAELDLAYIHEMQSHNNVDREFFFFLSCVYFCSSLFVVHCFFC